MEETTQAQEAEVNETPEVVYESPYYGHGLTQEQMDSIVHVEAEAPAEEEATQVETASQEETESQEEQPSAEQEDSVQAEPEGRDDVFVIDGREFSKEDIETWKTDSENKTEWQKSNTTKSQDLSAARKALEAETEKWKALRDDSDLMDAVKDYLGDEAEQHPIFSKVEAAVDEPTEEEKPDRVSELEVELKEIKTRLQVEQDLQALVSTHPELRDNEDALTEVINTMVNRNLPSLEDAFVIANAQATEKSAFKKAKKAVEEAQSAKKVPVQKGGIRGTRAKSIPKMKDYSEAREFALENYDLFEQ